MKNMIVENLKYLKEQLNTMRQGEKPFVEKKILEIAEYYKLIIEPYCYERSKNKDQRCFRKERMDEVQCQQFQRTPEKV